MSEQNSIANTQELSPGLDTNFGSSLRKIFSLAFPMMSIQFIQVASSFLCMVMLAHLGPHALAASALIYATQMPIMVIGMSILFSLSILVGRAYGAKNYIQIGNFVQQGWTLGLMTSIPIMLIYWNIGRLLMFLGQAPDLAMMVQSFFHAYIFAVIPLQLLVCNQQLCYGVGRQKLVMCISLFSVPFLLITAYALIFGKLGLPACGIPGLGYAMSIQVWLSLVIMTTCFYCGKRFEKFDLFHYRVHKNWDNLKQMLKIGWPISVQIAGEVLSLFASAAIVGWLGATSLAAFQVSNQYVFLVMIPIFTLAQASGILVGQACGSKNYGEINKLGTTNVNISLCISLLVLFIFLTFPKKLASLYFDVNNPLNAETLHLVVLSFAILAFTQIFDAIRNVLTGGLRGLLDTKFPMYVGLISIWLVGLPLGYLFAFTLHWGVVGVAIGSAIGITIGALILMLRWRVLSKKYAQPFNTEMVNLY